MGNIKNRVGETYGHWIVIAHDDEQTALTKKHYWLCECDCGCGTRKSIRGDALSQVVVGGCNNMTMKNPKICEKCGNEFYPKKQAKTRHFCYDCVSEEDYDNGAAVRRKVKQWALEYKGNGCSRCGYNKCTAALEFHHLDMNEKEFILSSRDIKFHWPVIQKELDKCILVCANCHRELHNMEESDNNE